MGKIFSLASLTSERNEFEGNTGTFLFLNADDEDVLVQSLRYNLHEELDEIESRRMAAHGKDRIELAQEWLNKLREATATYFVNVSDEERQSWTHAQCFHISKLWRENINPIVVATTE